MANTKRADSEIAAFVGTNPNSECAECGALGWDNGSGLFVPDCECEGGPTSPSYEPDAESAMTEHLRWLHANADDEEDRMLRALGVVA